MPPPNPSSPHLLTRSVYTGFQIGYDVRKNKDMIVVPEPLGRDLGTSKRDIFAPALRGPCDQGNKVVPENDSFIKSIQEREADRTIKKVDPKSIISPLVALRSTSRQFAVYESGVLVRRNLLSVVRRCSRGRLSPQPFLGVHTLYTEEKENVKIHTYTERNKE